MSDTQVADNQSSKELPRRRKSRTMSNYIKRMYQEQEQRRNSNERKQKLFKRCKCFSCCI